MASKNNARRYGDLYVGGDADSSLVRRNGCTG
jgi:hypothetical protein